MIIYNILAYSFYRIRKFYLKSGHDDPYQAAAIVSLMITTLLLDVWLILYTTLWVKVSEYKMPNLVYFFFVISGLFIYFLNVKYLVPAYWRFDKRWCNEPLKRKKMRGYLIVFVLLLSPAIGTIWLYYFS